MLIVAVTALHAFDTKVGGWVQAGFTAAKVAPDRRCSSSPASSLGQRRLGAPRAASTAGSRTSARPRSRSR